MKSNDRREFIRKSILGITGATLFQHTVKSHGVPTVPYSTSPELPVRTLGRTGIITPLISFGTSGVLDTGFIRSAYEAGINMFFSATYYGEGKNEILVGEGLKSLPRESFVVGTAIPYDDLDHKSGTFRQVFDADSYIKKAEGSLKRFGLDHVDFLLFPYASKRETILNEGLLKVLEKMKKQGMTRFLGIASHGGTEEALKAAVDGGVYDVAMISYNYKLKNIDSLNSAVADAVKAGIGIVAMKSTAGVYNEKSGIQPDSDAVLKWVLQNENISSIVSGMSSLEQLQKNISMIRNLKLSEQELKELERASIDSDTGLYCQQCGQCLHQCHNDLDIPAIMRSYMYAYGYKNISQAWHNLTGISLPSNPCENCGTCQVKCISGFDVRKKIRDIARLRDIPEEFLMA